MRVLCRRTDRQTDTAEKGVKCALLSLAGPVLISAVESPKLISIQFDSILYAKCSERTAFTAATA